MSATPRSASVPMTFARFFVDPRAAVRGLLESAPSEGRILAFGMFAACVVFIRQTLPIFRSDDVTDEQLAQFIEHLVSALFFLPLGFYLAALFATLIAKVLRGQGTWYEGRVAFFWALFVSTAVLLLTETFVRLLAPWMPFVMGVILWNIAIVFCPWALAQCFAEAFRFTRTWLVFAVTGAPMLMLYVTYLAQSFT